MAANFEGKVKTRTNCPRFRSKFSDNSAEYALGDRGTTRGKPRLRRCDRLCKGRGKGLPELGKRLIGGAQIGNLGCVTAGCRSRRQPVIAVFKGSTIASFRPSTTPTNAI